MNGEAVTAVHGTGLKVCVVEDLPELQRHSDAITAFIEEVQPKYSSHVLDALVEWYLHFRTEESAPFASRRGMNFFGRKSTLRSPFFMLLFREGRLEGFVPFFNFLVDLGDGTEGYRVISFCPDSTIFFYSDLVARKGEEAPAVQSVLHYFTTYRKDERYIVLFNHVPSDAVSLPLLARYSMDLPLHGFNVSLSPLLWRGGLYPWNLDGVKEALSTADLTALPETAVAKIGDALKEIAASNRTMLIFKKNHLPLKAAIYGIFNEVKPSNAMFELYNAIEEIFHSSPVKYPYLTLPASPSELEESLSQSKRYYFRRYRKQFLGEGGRFEKVQAQGVTARDIEDFVSLHRERWGSHSNILNKLTSPFIVSLLRKLADNGRLTLFFAVHEEQRVACVCCLDFKARREFFSSGRDPKAEKLRAGKLLLHEAIIDSIDSGFSRFDFGYGDEAYKSDYNWSHLTNNVVALFHGLHPKKYQNVFSLYEEVTL